MLFWVDKSDTRSYMDMIFVRTGLDYRLDPIVQQYMEQWAVGPGYDRSFYDVDGREWLGWFGHQNACKPQCRLGHETDTAVAALIRMGLQPADRPRRR